MGDNKCSTCKQDLDAESANTTIVFVVMMLVFGGIVYGFLDNYASFEHQQEVINECNELIAQANKKIEVCRNFFPDTETTPSLRPSWVNSSIEGISNE